jgi:hypothetical protein
VNVVDAAVPLRSWTRNIPPEEALALLDLARPGDAVAAWDEAAIAALEPHDPGYRRTLVRLVGRTFLDVDLEEGEDDPVNGTIADSDYLRLVQEGPEQRRADLVAVRYALAHVWPLMAARLLVSDGLRGPGEIGIAEWDTFVDTWIEPDTSVASRRKTRSTVIGALVALGVVERQAASAAPTVLRRGRPDPLAFGWAVREQLEGELRDAATVEWVAHHSDAALLYAADPEYARACLRAAVGRKLLVSRDVDGEPGVAVP